MQRSFDNHTMRFRALSTGAAKLKHYTLSAQSQSGSSVVSQAEGHTLRTDLPRATGGADTAAQPVIHLLHALAGCELAEADERAIVAAALYGDELEPTLRDSYAAVLADSDDLLESATQCGERRPSPCSWARAAWPSSLRTPRAIWTSTGTRRRAGARCWRTCGVLPQLSARAASSA